MVPPGETRQFNVRLASEPANRVIITAAALGLDETNLIRTIVNECLPVYERRAERAKRKQPPVELDH